MKPREWWITSAPDYGQTFDPIGDVYCGPVPGVAKLIHVIEYPEYARLKATLDELESPTMINGKREIIRLNKEIERLKAENWVLRDTNLRTYDGLAEKADKYDELNQEVNKIREDCEYAIKMLSDSFEKRLTIAREAIEKIEGYALKGTNQISISVNRICLEALEKLK